MFLSQSPFSSGEVFHTTSRRPVLPSGLYTTKRSQSPFSSGEVFHGLGNKK